MAACESKWYCTWFVRPHGPTWDFSRAKIIADADAPAIVFGEGWPGLS
jgi:hypothetical protein